MTDTPLILGLTGSIGMGKSTTAQMFADAGVPVFDADAEVHKLQQPGGAALDKIDDAFPGVVIGGLLDRDALGKKVFADPDALRALEAIMHPLVADARAQFFQDAIAERAPLLVLDIPLLFEKGLEKSVHKTVVVTAPADVQRARVLAREAMTDAKLDDILARQVPDAEKRDKADFIIDTGKGLDQARDQVHALIKSLRHPS